MNPKNILPELKKAVKYRNLFTLALDVILHKLLINTYPGDYFKFEFYKNEKSLEEKSRYVSQHGSMYYPHGNNLLKYNVIFINKYIQKAILRHFQLPTTTLITTIGKKLEISDRVSLNRFLDIFEKDIVIKPVYGTHGSGFLSLSRKGDILFAGKKTYSKDDVWKHLSPEFNKKGYIVEDKIVNPDSIRAIHPESLNTFRFIMIKTMDGRWHNASCYIKFGVGGSQVDNVTSGGVSAQVDTNGRTFSANHKLTGKSITHHPDTGHPLINIRIEGYKEAVELAHEACRKFGFMGSLGLDIASSIDGPVIVEANAWWGDSQKQFGKGIITNELAKGLKKRNCFTPWDKALMNPWMSRRPWSNSKNRPGSKV